MQYELWVYLRHHKVSERPMLQSHPQGTNNILMKQYSMLWESRLYYPSLEDILKTLCVCKVQSYSTLCTVFMTGCCSPLCDIVDMIRMQLFMTRIRSLTSCTVTHIVSQHILEVHTVTFIMTGQLRKSDPFSRCTFWQKIQKNTSATFLVFSLPGAVPCRLPFVLFLAAPHWQWKKERNRNKGTVLLDV